MCNAWNHPIGCTCGWGGPGHLGRRESSGQTRFSYEVFGGSAAREIGYVNPHARCPVCGASVFFYQSPEGGRVFFDELGPPWPKHPCTDRGRSGAFADPEVMDLTVSVMEHHAPEGWEPFMCELVRSVPHRDVAELIGSFRGHRITMFARMTSLLPNAPYYVQQIGEHRYRLSTCQPRHGSLPDLRD
jgi:hypothetical protein